MKEADANVKSIWNTEWLSMQMGIKTVASEDEALDHIATYGSGHSESIVSNNETAQKKFQAMVDAACVYVNAPTSFTDGVLLGLGGMIGTAGAALCSIEKPPPVKTRLFPEICDPARRFGSRRVHQRTRERSFWIWCPRASICRNRLPSLPSFGEAVRPHAIISLLDLKLPLSVWMQ